MLRSLALALLAFQPTAAVPQTVIPQEAIPLVNCAYTAGSAFRIGPNILLSVDHVTSGQSCAINGQQIHILYASGKSDFSILSDSRAGRWLKIDCNGFVRGRKYIAIGHPRGLDKLVGIPLLATGTKDSGLAVLIGIFTAQPGQSGGPVVDAETGAVVGTVNAADWENGETLSVELKGTPVCQRGIV